MVMKKIYNENSDFLSVIGTTVYHGMLTADSEIQSKEYLKYCYGRNHVSNIRRAVVEYELLKLGSIGENAILSKEEYTKKQTSFFLKMNFNDELILTTFRLRNRGDFPKKANYRGNYAENNQISLFPEYEEKDLVLQDQSYGIICFGKDAEGIFSFIGYPDENNKEWIQVTNLEDYFNINVEPEVFVDEVQPKLKISQEVKDGVI